jgi:DNA-binding YbaB/EbfC family protein
MNNIMAQAQKMQKDIEKKQKEINSTSFIGESEWVEITLKGDKTVEKINIKNKNTMDEEDLECLEDMIKIAINDAHNKINAEIEKKMGMYSKLGGLF